MSVKLNLLCLFFLKNQLDHELEIKLSGKQLYQTDSVKCLRIHLDKYLTWKHEINNVAIKLDKGNSTLSKIRNYVGIKTLKSIYHAIFESHLSYASLLWAQNSSSLKRLYILQKKNHSGCFFKTKMLTQILFSKTQKF